MPIVRAKLQEVPSKRRAPVRQPSNVSIWSYPNLYPKIKPPELMFDHSLDNQIVGWVLIELPSCHGHYCFKSHSLIK